MTSNNNEDTMRYHACKKDKSNFVEKIQPKEEICQNFALIFLRNLSFTFFLKKNQNITIIGFTFFERKYNSPPYLITLSCGKIIEALLIEDPSSHTKNTITSQCRCLRVLFMKIFSLYCFYVFYQFSNSRPVGQII